MHILLLAQFFPPGIGGEERRYTWNGCILARAGCLSLRVTSVALRLGCRVYLRMANCARS